ncbi:osmotically inducible protein OsmC [Robertmurraya yapensis]|uniref:Osmotically inducible protein OsmC n=2 Tax=Bacillaceae TaxID=186817 RepID=A0A3S0KGE6_9BACI|nr:OsmC family protein [Bacillus yapensis]RTR26178.1 osmotically inducible protein OsmC [Bacillus yapensis]TKS93616.1 osmotically inducible protein OsmC [Bacillus yapensis]
MYKSQAVCDGGDLDCGSGLLLIIKKSMDPLAEGEILEVRSREKTVEEDLPAWCRMVKHSFLGSEPGDNTTCYFIRKGNGAQSDLIKDLEAAKGYQWSVRVQGNENLTAKIHARNHTLLAGQPADFSAKVEAPSAIDFFLGSLASCLIVGFKAQASKRNVTIDNGELTLKASIDNVLYHMELEDEGSPKISKISGTYYLSSPADEGLLEEIWNNTLKRSPIYQTLRETVEIDIKLSIVF